MISPFTPPGTKVAAITDGVGPGNLPPLTIGAVYTIDKIHADGNGRFGATLVETHHPRATRTAWKFWFVSKVITSIWVYDIKCFRRLELPRCLTDILDRAPINRELERIP